MTLPSLLSARASDTAPDAGDAASDGAADAASDGAADAASDGAADGAATDGAVVAAPLLEHAAAIAATATTPGSRRVRRISMRMISMRLGPFSTTSRRNRSVSRRYPLRDGE